MMDRDETFAEALLRELIDHQSRANELQEREVRQLEKIAEKLTSVQAELCDLTCCLQAAYRSGFGKGGE